MKTQTYKTPSCSFNSTARTPSTTQLYEWDFPDAPCVFYTEEVDAAIRYLVDNVATEVGWLGLVETLDDGNYLVTDLYVPEQTVSGTETDIDAETLCALAMEIEQAGKESEKLLYWGHSHVNMDVGPSSQDEIQIEEFLDNGCQIFIRGIYNKRGASKVDVYDVENNCIHQCVQNGLQLSPMNNKLKTALDKIIKTKIKKPKVTKFPALSQPYYNNFSTYSNSTYGKQNKEPTYRQPYSSDWVNDIEYQDEYFDHDEMDVLTNPFGYKE